MAYALYRSQRDGICAVKYVALMLSLLSVNCSASDRLAVRFLGATEVSIEKREIAKVRELGTPGGQLATVTLRGLPESGNVVIGDPRRGPMMRYINPIIGSCGNGLRIGAGQLGEVTTDDRFFRDYVGQGGLDASWRYWISFTPSFCQTGKETIYDPDVDAYFICAGKSERFRCVRELARPDYSAYFFIEPARLGSWQKLDADVAAYLDRVVKPTK